VVFTVLCSRATHASNRSSNDTMMFMQSVSVTFGLSQEARRLIVESFCNDNLE